MNVLWLLLYSALEYFVTYICYKNDSHSYKRFISRKKYVLHKIKPNSFQNLLFQINIKRLLLTVISHIIDPSGKWREP